MGTGKNGIQTKFIATGLNTTNGPTVLIFDDSMEYVVRIVDPVLKGDVLYVEPEKQIFSETWKDCLLKLYQLELGRDRLIEP